MNNQVSMQGRTTKVRSIMSSPFAALFHRAPFLQRGIAFINTLLVSKVGIKIVPAGFLEVREQWLRELLYFQRLFNLLENVNGDVVECGVLNGESLVRLATVVRNTSTRRRIWGFDSWQGLPSPTEKDLSTPEAIAKKGQGGWASMQVVLDNLRASGLSEDDLKEQVTLVKGFFSDTLPKCGISSIAMLHIDADLYDSYKVALECLYPKVAIGGVIALDEYDDRSWPGATKAVDEFLKCKEGELTMHRDSITGKYYIVKVKREN